MSKAGINKFEVKADTRLSHH